MDKGKLRNNIKGKSAYIIRSPLRDAVRSNNGFINALVIVFEFGNDGVYHINVKGYCTYFQLIWLKMIWHRCSINKNLSMRKLHDLVEIVLIVHHLSLLLKEIHDSQAAH